MADLLEQLKEEHAEILRLLRAVRDQGPSSEAGRSAIDALRPLFSAHVARELPVYDKLGLSEAGGASLGRPTSLLFAGLKEVERHLADFYEKLATARPDAREFGRLYAALRIRIDIEEQMVFPDYGKLAQR